MFLDFGLKNRLNWTSSMCVYIYIVVLIVTKCGDKKYAQLKVIKFYAFSKYAV